MVQRRVPKGNIPVVELLTQFPLGLAIKDAPSEGWAPCDLCRMSIAARVSTREKVVRYLGSPTEVMSSLDWLTH